jgi:hypothetical protein
MQQADVVIQKNSSEGDYFGDSITSGDLDGDGDAELIVAAPGTSASGVFVFDLE